MLSTHAANVSYGPRVGFDGTVHSKVGGLDGAFYYTQYADGPDDRVDVSLWMHDGVEHRVLLASGDVISRVGGEVANIVFATTTNHVDTEQRIVMLCEFTDGDAAIVVGVPA